MVHRAEMRGAEGERVQKLQRERREQPRYQPHQAPAHDAGSASDDHQAERPDARASKRVPCQNSRISATTPSAHKRPITASEKPSERQ